MTLLMAMRFRSTVLAGLALLVATDMSAKAQQRSEPAAGAPEQAAPQTPPSPSGATADATRTDLPRETVHADVSTRRVAVTSTFRGTEIVIFGAIDNNRQPSAEAGVYDIVITVEGPSSRLVARRKSNVAGLWINTSSLSYEAVPSYYAIASTRPLEEIANKPTLKVNNIGFEHVRMVLSNKESFGLPDKILNEFRDAVVRIKQKDQLYIQEQYGVAFIGSNLFRANIDLPANVTIGPFETKVFLFRDGKLLNSYTARLSLEREGLEKFLHAAAFGYPFLYGIATVLIAIGAGLLASTLFRRASH